MAKIGLVALVKDPWLVPAKTRLAASIGVDDAMAFYRESLRCLAAQLERFSLRGWQVLVSHSPREPSKSFRNIFSKIDCVAQLEGDLGQRIRGADSELRAQDADVTVFLGGDSPDLSDDAIVQIADIQDEDASLILSDDGGFVALSTNRILPSLENVRWSHQETSRDMISALNAASFKVTVQGSWFDVDEAEDLFSLYDRLQLQSHQVLPELKRVCHELTNRHRKSSSVGL